MNDDDKSLRRTGLGMMLLFWLIVLGMGAWWFNGFFDERRNPNANLAQTLGEGSGPVTLRRNVSGHFVAPGAINGEPVQFLLDTGATYIAIPGELAERLGLERGASAYFSTANGPAQGYLTTLERVSLGGLTAYNVRGSINPSMRGSTALLGMSFLSRFDIQMGDGELVLSPAGER